MLGQAIVTVLVISLFGLGLGASATYAAVGHQFVSDFSTVAGGSLEEPTPLATDHADGELFVGDQVAGYVDVFDASGKNLTRFGNAELSPSGIAVDESTGVVYVADASENAIDVFKPDDSGEYTLIGQWAGEALSGHEFGEVTGVGVDNSNGASAGDVYVVDGEDRNLAEGAVDVFKPTPTGPEEGAEGKLVRVLSKGKMEEPNGIAVDSNSGKVFVADSVKGGVYAFSATGAAEGKLIGKGGPEGTFSGPGEEEGNVTALAVDPVSGDLVVAEAERDVVSELNAAGEWVGWITSSPTVQFGEPRGVALSSGGDVYVADALLSKVDLFGLGTVVPNATTSKASKLTRTTAVLPGIVNGQGRSGRYFFEYGTSKTLGSSTPPTAFAGAEEKVSAVAGELHAGTAYYFRIVAESENGASYGATYELQTPTAVEGLSTGAVADLLPTSATLTGSLLPNGVDAHYSFQWGRTTSYGNETETEDSGSGKSAVAAEAALSGLNANTTYHYRLVATNSYGTTVGADKAFATSGPPRITDKPVTGIGHDTATLNGEVNPDELETSYQIEYGETESYGTDTPSGGASLGSGGKPVPIAAALIGLKLGVTYHYRIIATNSAGTTVSLDRSFTTVPPALVTDYATEVSPTAATLGATVNPLGHDTTYYFQYGTAPCSTSPTDCIDSPAAPGEDVGAGESSVTETLALTALVPATSYHYRVIAANSLGEATGAEHTITTPKPSQPMPLPDGRAWELVTPPAKGAAPVEGLTREGGVILASENGGRITYLVDGALGEHVEGNRSPEWQQILAQRGPSAWASQDIATGSVTPKGITAGQTPEYQYFTPELTLAVDEPPGPTANPPLASEATEGTPYLRDLTAGSFTPLLTAHDTAPGTQFGGHVHFVDASSDLQHVLLTSNVGLAGSQSAPGLYEWTQGNLTLASILPTQQPATEPELGYENRIVSNAVSSDGSRVIWTNREDSATRGGHLYMRSTESGKTLQLDAAQGVSEPAKGSAIFQGASPDDSRVWFTDRQRLTPSSTAEPGQGTGRPDLYECEVVEQEGSSQCRLTDLTVDAVEGEHASVQGLVLGANTSGTVLYFVASGVLAENVGSEGSRPTPGAANLYVAAYDGTTWTRSFIGTLSPEDSPEWTGNQLGDSAFLTARVSPNGRYLAFMSAASLTGYDNADVNPAANGAHDEEVFLYDGETMALRCVSCNPTGKRPVGVHDQKESGEGRGLLVDRHEIWAEPGHEHWLAGNIPGWTAQNLTSAIFQSRYLSDSGRLFFNSPDDLVPAATNHKQDVYEYEPSGVGSCESTSGGCLELLSSGSSSRESAFLEATPDGASAFFVTASQLLPQDSDTAFDIYDARTCTDSSPCQTVPTPPPAPCSELQTCRPAEAPTPIAAGAGGTQTYVGPGNPPVSATKNEVADARTSKSAPKSKPTRAMLLAKALHRCRSRFKKLKGHRTSCERLARKRYGPRRLSKHHKTTAHRRPGSKP